MTVTEVPSLVSPLGSLPLEVSQADSWQFAPSLMGGVSTLGFLNLA